MSDLVDFQAAKPKLLGDRPLRLSAYYRVSRRGDRSGPTYISKEVMKSKIDNYIANQGGTMRVVEEIVDENSSGGEIDRPRLMRIMDMIENKEVDGIIIARQDRLSRDVRDTLNIADQIQMAGGILICAEEDIDITDPNGRMVVTMKATISQMELEKNKQHWHDTHARNVREGVGSRAPFGYTKRADLLDADGQPVPLKIEQDEHGNTILDEFGKPKVEHPGRFIPDKKLIGKGDQKTRAEWVQWIFTQYASGMPIGQIVSFLNDNEVFTLPRKNSPQGSRWSNSSLTYLLKNRTYLGEIAYRYSHNTEKGKQKIKASGRLRAQLTRDDLVNENAHQALVDNKLFETCQKRFVKRGFYADHNDEFLLNGILRCASCRYNMRPIVTDKGSNQYSCRAKSDGCKNCAHINQDLVERWAEKQFKVFLQQRDDEWQRISASDKDMVEASERAEELTKSYQKIVDNYDTLEDLWGHDKYVEKATAAKNAMIMAEEELKDISRKYNGNASRSATILSEWDNMPVTDRKMIIAEIMPTIFIRPKSVDGRKLSLAERLCILSPEDELKTAIPRRGKSGYQVEPVPADWFYDSSCAKKNADTSAEDSA